ncbi:hypothetical protein C2I27_10895 [Priestia megaterium]|nr:hypothetical protein C2I27_10895 [Priestia megaterium]
MRPRRSASDEEAHQPPAESEVLHRNQQRCHKQSLLEHLSHLFVFRLEWFRYGTISFFSNFSLSRLVTVALFSLMHMLAIRRDK